MKVNARKVILEVLNEWNKEKYVNRLLMDVNNHPDLEIRDKNFISKVVYGVVENKLLLDYVIRKNSSVRLKKIDPSILNVLRMASYQILFLDKTPDSAAVNEAVKIAKKVSFRHSGFVNGVLRSITRMDEIAYPTDVKERISIKYSHPLWLVERWIELFGSEFTEDLCKANNETPHLSLRVNTQKVQREDLITKLETSGISVRKSDIVEDGIIVENMKNSSLYQNDLFNQGYFTIQDESSMLVTEVLAPNPSDRILDLCAAPGGKTTHLAQRLENGSVTSCDVSENKLALINENKSRLSLDNIEVVLNDALVLNEAFIGQFDKVLVDAPCTGFGIIRRKPDIKYYKSSDDSLSLQEIQIGILKNAAKYIKEDGEIVYSTCTIDPIENQEVIKLFLASDDRFKVSKEKILYPNVDETDGFYVCKLEKIGV
jgi:16S rRNA (cytosine967-C5)-methyltransferase